MKVHEALSFIIFYLLLIIHFFVVLRAFVVNKKSAFISVNRRPLPLTIYYLLFTIALRSPSTEPFGGASLHPTYLDVLTLYTIRTKDAVSRRFIWNFLDLLC